MRCRYRRVGVGLLALVSLCAAPRVGSAQENSSSLEEVEELTRLGRTEEAREMLVRWWDRGRAEASRPERQRGLWLRGRLTVDPTQAALDFQRLVLEYPGGDFSDRALLRLAQSAWAVGDRPALEAHLDRLRRDYPGSPVAREARRWEAAAGPLPDPPVAEASGEEEAGGMRTGDPPNAAAAPLPTPESAPATPPSAATGARFAVQLGAFAGEGRARDLRNRVRSAGYDVRLTRVEGSRLLHVRVGRFTSQARAQALLDEIRELGLDATLVQDVSRERESDEQG